MRKINKDERSTGFSRPKRRKDTYYPSYCNITIMIVICYPYSILQAARVSEGIFLDRGQEQYPHYKFSPLNSIIIVIIKMKRYAMVAIKARFNWAWHRDLVQYGKTESCKNRGLPRDMEDSCCI